MDHSTNIRARATAALASAVALAALTLAGCAVVDRSAPPAIAKNDSVAILPIANNTETPQAGQRAASIAQSLLASYGYTNLSRYPASADDETLFDAAKPDAQQNALNWARQQNARYALTGAVNEWRYKVGVDGEPAVGLTFDVIDVQTGKVVWTGTGSRTGWSRDAVSGVAQKLERDLLSPLAR
ncbi:penicillin-binding protein activator LpoB [Paraburkholderia azotifigens]|uniref:Penicillin-binding protein activator LpoB n=1 Tax=Paraburkholderia azotifigens TaxID=2057004 RepID=A0A5C6VH22_9BURK|nr:penicillin-binding protein activator LpoB [Paraburkholderia azotifigens]TXC84220.1 penicillin-binding protein activator LpoB [Paraburkholderia azotifigens]